MCRLDRERDAILPRNLAGANHIGNQEKDALRAVGAENGESQLVVIAVAIIESHEYSATRLPVPRRAIDER